MKKLLAAAVLSTFCIVPSACGAPRIAPTKPQEQLHLAPPIPASSVAGTPASTSGEQTKERWKRVRCFAFGSSLAWGGGRGQQSCEVLLEFGREVVRLEVPENTPMSDTIYSSLTAMPIWKERMGAMIPALVLGQKAKRFDDGLYAAVELAARDGAGLLPGQKTWLRAMAKLLTERQAPIAAQRKGAAVITAAAQVVGVPPLLDPPWKREADELLRVRRADPTDGPPLGFYAWNDELRQTWDTKHLLHTTLEPEESLFLANTVAQDDGLVQSYGANLRLFEQLTNPFRNPDLREVVGAMRKGKVPSVPNGAALVPASRSHETVLVLQLFPRGFIPEGFDLSDELVKRIRTGKLDLTPTARSGWYDHQTFALEPLLLPDKMPEAAHLELTDSYKQELERLFKSLLSLSREVHAGQATAVRVGAGRDNTLRLVLKPELSVEPLPTHYLRRVQSYRFVRQVLQEAFGAPTLASLHRWTEAGPVSEPLDQELDNMEALFRGAYDSACEELSMDCPPDPTWTVGAAPEADRAAFRSWASSVTNDQDLGVDIRMMVPVFYDRARQQTKVWAVLGMAEKWLNVRYATIPGIKQIRDSSGHSFDPYELELSVESSTRVPMPYVVSAEVYVTKVLSRGEFQRHCDRYKTANAILKNLR